MARMPGAQWVGPHHDNGTMTRYDVVCLHTIVGSAPAHAAHFSTAGNGTIFQSRDTAFRSAANFNGNHRVIAIENADRDGSFLPWDINNGHAVPGFTVPQIESIAKICAWAYQQHGIPLVPCPDSRPGSKGIAFHRQGIEGNWAGYAYSGIVPGGEVWTKSKGKVCPGDRRISQIPQIIARARVLAGLNREDDMQNWILAQEANSPRVWLGNLMFRRHVQDEIELAGLQYWLGQTGGNPDVQEGFEDIRVLGVDVATLTTPPPV